MVSPPPPVNVMADHRRLITTLESMRRRYPIVGTTTLATSQTTTTVTDHAMTVDRMVLLTPTDANGASETAYVSARANGSFTITHSNASSTRSYLYCIL